MASKRSLLLPALLVFFALPAMARSLDAPKAPPAEPVYEVDPGDRTGYTRVLGHWEWTGGNFMWSPGKWVEDREGFVWVGDAWSQRGKKWHLTPGHYEPDGSAPAPVATEAAEPQIDLHADKAADVPKEHVEPVAQTREEEMNDVEQRILAPSKNSVTPAPAAKPVKASTHKKRAPVKKAVNYNDQKQFPRYRHH